MNLTIEVLTCFFLSLTKSILGNTVPLIWSVHRPFWNKGHLSDDSYATTTRTADPSWTNDSRTDGSFPNILAPFTPSRIQTTWKLTLLDFQLLDGRDFIKFPLSISSHSGAFYQKGK